MVSMKNGLVLSLSDAESAETNHRPRVCIEAAHFYTNYTQQDVEEKCLEGARIGAICADVYAGAGFHVESMLFIDDYNPEFEGKPACCVSEEDYLKQIEEQGFVPDKIVYESELVDMAEEALAQLADAECFEESGLCFFKGLYLKKDGKYSCSLLDGMLTQIKLVDADFAINVLPSGWKSQQENALRVAKGLGVDPSLIRTFYYKPGADAIQTQDRAKIAAAYFEIFKEVVRVQNKAPLFIYR